MDDTTRHEHAAAVTDRAAAPARDHVAIGRELGIFTTDPLVGAGLPLWLPAGTAVRQAIDGFVTELERRSGHQHVMTPHLGKRRLYELSGHWEHFADDMWPPMAVGGDELVLRPVNCPHHVLVYRHALRSIADLPLRIAELGGMYRMERSGVLTGLSRVRSMTLNDAHVFCAPEQVDGEVASVLDDVDRCYEALGLEVAEVRLSTRGAPGTWAGEAADWDRAEAALRAVLADRGVDAVEAPGEGAFYGPKIDVEVVDAHERTLTLSTVQVDLWMPGRFDLTYVDSGGARRRPVMVHRSLLSTAERLVAHLLEHHDGALPFWCAPEQVVVLPVTDEQAPAAEAVAASLVAEGLRATSAGASSSLGRRVRAAASRRVPVILVLGPREVEADEVSVRLRGGGRARVVDRGACEEALVAADRERLAAPAIAA